LNEGRFTMQLCKAKLRNGEVRVGVVNDGAAQFLAPRSLGEVLHAADPAAVVRQLLTDTRAALADVTLLPPIDAQEVWAAGVTYKPTREAREPGPAGPAPFYHLVYTADRPELFFKAAPRRVVGPGGRVRIRRDSKWSVPEPE